MKMTNEIVSRSNLMKNLVTASYLLVVVTSLLSVLLPINDIHPGDISLQYPSLFMPAPYTLMIWPIIYLALAGFVYFQAGGYRKGNGVLTPSSLRRIQVGFILSCLLDALWTISWHYQRLSLSFIFVMSLLSVLAYVNHHTQHKSLHKRERYLLRVPFSLYFGGTTLIALMNLLALLEDKQWTSLLLSPLMWAVVLLFGMVLFVLVIIIQNKNPLYGLIVIWAYGGILANHLLPGGFDGEYYSIMIITVSCMVVIFVASVVSHLSTN